MRGVGRLAFSDSVHPIHMHAIGHIESRVDFPKCAFSELIRLREPCPNARHTASPPCAAPAAGFRGFRVSDPDARSRIFSKCVSDFRIARFLNSSDYANSL
jgi:hypothetical protein